MINEFSAGHASTGNMNSAQLRKDVFVCENCDSDNDLNWFLSRDIACLDDHYTQANHCMDLKFLEYVEVMFFIF